MYSWIGLTGYAPQNITLKPGFVGYSDKYEPNDVWNILLKYKQWNCLMGCSIQPNPKEASKVHDEEIICKLIACLDCLVCLLACLLVCLLACLLACVSCFMVAVPIKSVSLLPSSLRCFF